jgi:hypothetical protein
MRCEPISTPASGHPGSPLRVKYFKSRYPITWIPESFTNRRSLSKYLHCNLTAQVAFFLILGGLRWMDEGIVMPLALCDSFAFPDSPGCNVGLGYGSINVVISLGAGFSTH